MSQTEILANYDGQWVAPSGASLPVTDPATARVLASVPLSQAADVARTVEAAAAAFPAWRRMPAGDRIQYLFRLKALLDCNFDDLAGIITAECGKTLGESRGELRRAIENVEVACGIPLMLQGYNSEDISTGIDEIMIRQPLGVVTAITPFNFPAMIPLWFLPYAIACGNTFILKPLSACP
jgi:malonate-semialdehyde dehydrogenase (acetylating) / methylmalonate-semialdehyde dehydrogenase